MREPQNNDYFPLSEYQDRMERLRVAMRASDMDALVVSTEPNVVYCTGSLNGYWIATMHDDAQIALITAQEDDEPTLFLADSLEQTALTSCISDIRVWSQFTGGKGKGSVETIVDTFGEKKLQNATVGLEIGPHDRPGMSLPFLEHLKSALPKVAWKDSTDVMKQVRKVKSAREIEKFRVACKITCQAFEAGLDSIRKGKTEKQIGHVIAMEMARMSFDACVNHPWIIFVHASGRGPCAFDGVPSDYSFRTGDSVYIDGGFIYQGYGADMIRCAVVGKPSPEQERYYYASRDANMTALRSVRPGIKGKDLYDTWRTAACGLGFESSIRNQNEADWDFLGHGLGLTVHELPLLNSKCEEPIVPGMVMAIEGNVFDAFPFSKTGYALKNEENVLVTDAGYEWLTPLRNDLWIAEG